jgi:DNA polymerase (family 10)
MKIHNREIAGIFEELADLLEVEGANRFRVRAYRDAARVIGGMSEDLADLVESGSDLTELPNIGEAIAKKIRTVVETGSLPQLTEVEGRTPASLSEMMKLEGLGPKRVKTLHEKLGIDTLDDLRAAVEAHKVRQLEGFGPKTEETIRERLARWQGEERRTLLFAAEDIAKPLVAYLEAIDGIKDITVAGSYRRRKETVGDLDILVTCKRGTPVMDRFVGYDEVSEVVSKGDTRSTVRLRSGMQVDLRVLPQVSYGAALHYFTGSKAHNIAVRKLGVKRGLKINEYGVFRGDERVAGGTEEEVYGTVDLPYIPPELREDRGEIDAAREGKLPRLVERSDIRGDLHAHTKETDGHNSLREMAEAAAEQGYDYLAITDHSQHLSVAKGLDEKRLARQIEAIDRLNEDLEGRITVLKGIEVDVLEDGSLDLPDSILERLDLRVCSVHYKFNLSKEKQTERVLRAMDNPLFNILAHPSGRLLEERDPYELDLERIMEAAAERGCFLEVNAQPSRLDLSDSACKLAKEMGVKVAISTDAHGVGNLALMRFGIGQARRGWLEAKDVINTRPLKDLLALLKRA